MKILVLMPLQEQSAYMAMGIYKNLPADIKDKTFCMPAFMDYLVSMKLSPNWEYALFDTLLSVQKVYDVAEKDDLIVLGNTVKTNKFDVVFNFQDIERDLKYEDVFLNTMREKVASEALLSGMVEGMYDDKDSRMKLHNCKATADFLTAYLQTDPHLAEIEKEYKGQLRELKHGNK